MPSVTVSHEIETKLKYFAEHQEQTPEAIVNDALLMHLEHLDDLIDIQNAEEEAKEGAFISSDAISEWMHSLGSKTELPFPKPDTFLK